MLTALQLSALTAGCRIKLLVSSWTTHTQCQGPEATAGLNGPEQLHLGLPPHPHAAGTWAAFKLGSGPLKPFLSCGVGALVSS